MYGYIYMTTDITNNKKYIGKHKASEFTTKYIGSGKYLLRAIKQHGKENFKVVMLEACNTLEELNEKEKFYIAKYDALKSKDFYNIHPGGDGGDIALYLSESKMVHIRKDHSKYILDRLNSDEEFHSRFAGAKNGHKCYQSTRDKIGSAQKNYWSRTPYEIKHERLSRSAKTRCTGRIWITNEVIDKFIKPEHLDEFLKVGFRIGRKFQKRNRPCKKRQTTIESITNEKDIGE